MKTTLIISIIIVTFLFIKCGNNNDILKIVKPFKNIENKTHLLNIDVSKDTIISFSTGTQISIQANSFVDKNNEVVKGEVQINFKEFHNASDIIASGFPMLYDSLGVKNPFESRGMFEISAKQNNKNIFIAKDKNISVNLASYTNDEKFKHYYLSNSDIVIDSNKKDNEIQKDLQWKYIEQSNIANNTKKSNRYFKLKFDISKNPKLEKYADIIWELSDPTDNKTNPNLKKNNWALNQKWESVDVYDKVVTDIKQLKINIRYFHSKTRHNYLVDFKKNKFVLASNMFGGSENIWYEFDYNGKQISKSEGGRLKNKYKKLETLKKSQNKFFFLPPKGDMAMVEYNMSFIKRYYSKYKRYYFEKERKSIYDVLYFNYPLYLIPDGTVPGLMGIEISQDNKHIVFSRSIHDSRTDMFLSKVDNLDGYLLKLKSGNKTFTVKVKSNNIIEKDDEITKEEIENELNNMKLRLKQEADYLHLFNINKFGIYSSCNTYQYHPIVEIQPVFDFGENDNSASSIIKIYHITGKKQTAIILYTEHSDIFKFNPKENNQLLAILPNNKVGYFSNKDFSSINIDEAKANRNYVFKMKIIPYVESLEILEGIVQLTK